MKDWREIDGWLFEEEASLSTAITRMVAALDGMKADGRVTSIDILDRSEHRLREIDNVARSIGNFKYHNTKEPKKIYMTYTQLNNIRRECNEIKYYEPGSTITTLFGLIIVAIPDNGYLIE